MVRTSSIAGRCRLKGNLLDEELAQLSDDGRLLGQFQQAAEFERQGRLERHPLVVRQPSLRVHDFGVELSRRRAQSSQLK